MDIIRKLEKDIETYRESLDNLEGALVEAERELQEELERRSAAGTVCPEQPE